MTSTVITLIIAILLLQAYITIAAYYLGRAEGYDQAKTGTYEIDAFGVDI